MQSSGWQVPRKPSARLTHGLKLETEVWLLRCSVFGGTPMASAIHFKELNCYEACCHFSPGIPPGCGKIFTIPDQVVYKLCICE